MVYKKNFLFFLTMVFSLSVNAQRTLKYSFNRYSFQYGFSLKASVEFGYRSTDPSPAIRFTINGGVASDFLSSWLYPAFNLEVQFYNGGFGSKHEKKDGLKCWDVDIITAITATAGTDNILRAGSTRWKDRDIPLYYFSDFVYPALQNPFHYSFSIGTDVIFSLNTDKETQRVGFINGHFDRVQVSYFNDGGAVINTSHAGDNKDRYYTGGGVVSYHGKVSQGINLIELSYKKFTGYTKNAFELSNNLYLNYMNYHAPGQRRYNKSLWSLNAANPFKGWGIKLSSFNSIGLDLQHYIHWGLFNTYHMVPYKPFWTLTGSYYNSYTKPGLQ
jgi:hypothetical protein